MSVFYRFLGTAFVFVGALQLLWCLAESAVAIWALSWPTAQGHIESAKIVEKRAPSRHSLTPTVTYTYAVDGKQHQGSRLYLRDVSDSFDRSRKTIEQFAPGQSVTVYYNPFDHSASLLRPGLYWYSYAWLALSLVAIAIGSVLRYFTRPQQLSSNAA